MLKPKRIDAIVSLSPKTGFSSDNDGNVIEWDISLTKSGLSQPTEKAIQTNLDSMISDWEVQAYARNRRAEYPSQGDQNDMIYKDNKNSTTTHADAVEAVKTKWPKDNSGPVE